MGKKNKKAGLGRVLIKDRFSNRRPNRGEECAIHTSELNDGYEWGRLNLQSVTEESSFEEFLSTATLVGKEFQAEKLNIKFINPKSSVKVLSPEERKKFDVTKEELKNVLKIPRRPDWKGLTREELLEAEKSSFIEWRRNLSQLEETTGLTLTPYERNIGFWRQLWRVVDKSDVVVQIVDARNPLLYWCEDLNDYVAEVKGVSDATAVILNKADLLTPEQRRAWALYFEAKSKPAFFFSAKIAQESIEEEEEEEEEEENAKETEESDEESQVEETGGEEDEVKKEDDQGTRGGELLGRDGLLEVLQELLRKREGEVLGLVGSPNVGKSSTINALAGRKRVSVSATPGKTKHFQTVVLEAGMTLCDCPGLVAPSVVAQREELVLGGMLGVDQGRDPFPAASLLVSLFPPSLFERLYSINLPRNEEPLTAHDLLAPYAYSRGLMTANGQPDVTRAAKVIIKQFQTGHLLHCVAPPGVDQESYHDPMRCVASWRKGPALPTPAQTRATQGFKVTSESLDKQFFSKMTLHAHVKGPNAPSGSDTTAKGKKAWKDHSLKRNRREKLRRVYRHLDEV